MTRAKNKKKNLSHYKDPIIRNPSRLAGRTRKAGDASIEVKNKVVAAIQKTSEKYVVYLSKISPI